MPFFGILVLFNPNAWFACSIVWANLLWESDFIRTYTLLLLFNDAGPPFCKCRYRVCLVSYIRGVLARKCEKHMAFSQLLFFSVSLNRRLFLSFSETQLHLYYISKKTKHIFVNIKIKSAQSFECIHRSSRMCMRVFI
jgi:hypothetical protein